ncbi:ORF29 [Leucania separata nucleopolyhedrovirus]|uniref:ORF29 n=1 Tax=Leucania separata nucleopolyhedrovirus TaxID=1307956 RepID=Q0IL90_NPVLS|nr:ORF29 [Leucania separata nucleopolyhedrovirus]AAR28793.1 ORF29 [Leucania separata nucleopolyhedrovirus]
MRPRLDVRVFLGPTHNGQEEHRTPTLGHNGGEAAVERQNRSSRTASQDHQEQRRTDQHRPSTVHAKNAVSRVRQQKLLSETLSKI